MVQQWGGCSSLCEYQFGHFRVFCNIHFGGILLWLGFKDIDR